MLVVREIKENFQQFVVGLNKRGFLGVEKCLKEIIELDNQRKEVQIALDETLKRSNELSKKIGVLIISWPLLNIFLGLIEAKQLFYEVIKSNNGNVDARDGLAQILLSEGNKQDALEQWKHILTIDPNHKRATAAVRDL